MEFNEKLQELRKQKGLTQEELAEVLYVSRTAISKWESGRGYPNIDSLKAISSYFSVSLDDLLSSDEVLTIAEESNKQKEKHFRDMVFGLLDCSVAMFFFLPLFGQRVDGVIQEVTLLSLTEIEPYVKIPYLIVVFWMVIWGILILALQNSKSTFWLRSKDKVSLGLSAVGALFFMISLQPYAAMFTFIFLIIKALMLIKWT
ncbi:MAG: helix-turn-helix transcriptional regulator [Lachnospiraceae bacterium]|nr:helix-turn-helix transcriptional regulator [Lachnospiraceae bacterium]MBP3507589.1 helix-turn-helix transcriptional regulator [Lachnospiraceae bacterium]